MKFAVHLSFFGLLICVCLPIHCDETICDILTGGSSDLQGTIPTNGLLYLIIRNVAFSVPLKAQTSAGKFIIDETAKMVGHWSQLPFLQSLPLLTLAEIVKNSSALLHVDGNDFIKSDASYQVVYKLATGAGAQRCRLFLSDNTPICENVTPAEHYSFISSGHLKSTNKGGFQLQESSEGGGRVDRLVFEMSTEDSSAVKVTRQLRLTESSVQLSSILMSTSRQPPSKYTFSLPVFGFIFEPNGFTHFAHLWLPSAQVVAIFDIDELASDVVIAKKEVPAQYIPFASYFTCKANAPKIPKVPPTAIIPNETNIPMAGVRLLRNPLIIGGAVFAAIVLLTGGCLVIQLTQGKALPKKRNQTRFEEKHYIAKHPRMRATTSATSSGMGSSSRTMTSTSKKTTTSKSSRKAKNAR